MNEKRKKTAYVVMTAVGLSGVVGAGIAVNEQLSHKLHETQNVQKYVQVQQQKAIKSKIKPVVVVFYKDGCPYCEKASSTLKSEARDNDEVKTVFVNIKSTAGQQLKEQFGVQKVPSVASISNNGSYALHTAQLITTGSVDTSISVNKTKLEQIYEVAEND